MFRPINPAISKITTKSTNRGIQPIIMKNMRHITAIIKAGPLFLSKKQGITKARNKTQLKKNPPTKCLDPSSIQKLSPT